MEQVNILIIEDDPMVSHINQKYAEKISGFKVVKNINIGNGMTFKHKDLSGVDLLLLDIYLPEKDGLTLLKEIRESNHTVDAIIISAAKDSNHISQAMQLGVVDYLIKPFTFERFKKALQDYKNMKDKLEGNTGFEQKEIDSLLRKDQQGFNKKTQDNVSYIRQLPKGLNDITLEKIVSFLKKKNDRFSTKEIAYYLGLSRVTAQRYLKYLCSQGILEVIREYGSVGRPKHFYKLKK